MANRSFRQDTASVNAGEVVISGGFQVDTANNPTVFKSADGIQSSNKPNGIYSITHSGTGEYTLTFLDQFMTCTGVSVHYESATASDTVAQFNGFSNLGSATASLTCKITTLTAGTAADVAASGTNGVWFTFRFKNSAVV